MAIEVRNIRSDAEYEEFVHLDGRVFGIHYQPEDLATLPERLVKDRVVVALDHGRIVGGGGVYPMALTLPGGIQVPAAGVSWVSVDATHRRRGVARVVMDLIHNQSRALGEPAQILTASEGGIYERFGYGVASHFPAVTIDRRNASIRSDAPSGGRCEFLDHLSLDEKVALCADTYEQYARLWSGSVAFISNARNWWMFFLGPIGDRVFNGQRHLVAHFDEHGSIDGIVIYRVESNWTERGPDGTAHVWQVLPLNDIAHAELWRVVLGIDLATHVTLRSLALDDQLRWLLTNARTLETTAVRDDLWLRPAQPLELLTKRRYGDEGRLRITVDQNRYVLDVDGSGIATCETGQPTTDTNNNDNSNDIRMTAIELGTILLGGTPPSVLARAGRIQGRTSAIQRADRLFRHEHLPHLAVAF